MNFNVQLFWKSKTHLVLCFISQLQYRKEDLNFKSNIAFQFIKKTKWHFRYTDLKCVYPKYHFAFLINWNMKLEIKFWFLFLTEVDTKNIKINPSSLFFVFHYNLKNEKPNLLKQISYKTSYHPPYATIMRIKESNSFNDQTSNSCKETFTCSNSTK